jgi:hypothetical protein
MKSRNNLARDVLEDRGTPRASPPYQTYFSFLARHHTNSTPQCISPREVPSQSWQARCFASIEHGRIFFQPHCIES